jgi:hypothetical protein
MRLFTVEVVHVLLTTDLAFTGQTLTTHSGLIFSGCHPNTSTNEMVLSSSKQTLWWLIFSGAISPSCSFQNAFQQHRPVTPFVRERTARRHYFYFATTPLKNDQPARSNNDDSNTKNDSNNNVQRQAALSINEFSRTVPPSRILRYRSPNNMVSIHIEANEAERYRLAERFELSNIAMLSADLTLMRHGSGGNSPNAPIQVEGTCYTTVRQRCVRTNEDFDVTMEVPLLCVVRPVVPRLLPIPPQLSSSEPPRNNNDDESSSSSLSDKGGNSSNNNNKTTKKKKRDRRTMTGGGGKFDEMAMVELERLLQTVDIDEDVLMEDEAIYAINGLLDVGELVAQLFWLSLDPYPKKPGTEPIFITLTG